MDSLLSSWTQKWTTGLEALKSSFLVFIQHFILALIYLIVGWVVAKFVQVLGRKIGQLIFRLVASIQNKPLSKSIKQRNKFANSLGLIFFWLTFVYFVFLALKTLDFPGIDVWLNYIFVHIPNILTAVFIIFFGFVFAAQARNMITAHFKSEGQKSFLIAQSVWLSIVAVSSIWGIEQVGINISILANFLYIAVSAMFGAIALGFGIGASHHVANIFAASHLKKMFEVGDNISFQDINGTILDINNAAVILETEQGTVVLPAKLIAKEACCKNN